MKKLSSRQRRSHKDMWVMRRYLIERLNRQFRRMEVQFEIMNSILKQYNNLYKERWGRNKK